MTTLQQQYAAGFKRQALNDIQRKAVADFLEAQGEIDRDFAYNVGLAACGRIKNLGGRIHELRHEGWHIKTDVREGVCFYVLISSPQAKQLALIN